MVSSNIEARSSSRRRTAASVQETDSTWISKSLAIPKYIYQLLLNTDAKSSLIVTSAVCLLDILLQLTFIRFVPYTEIDWSTYMEQVRLVVENKEFDYLNIHGSTGPLVYPAGFVYLYSILYFITSNGSNIFAAQLIYGGLHALTLFLVGYGILGRMKNTPAILPVCLLLSKRLHSIYVLRLFNDPWVILFISLSIILLSKKKVVLSSLMFTLSLSIKMNALLYLPGFTFILWYCVGTFKTFLNLILIILVQLLLALPFIVYGSLESYFKGAFDFNRQFLYKWTVNWKMIEESNFINPIFSRTLLIMHLSLLAIFFSILITRSRKLKSVLNIGDGYSSFFHIGFNNKSKDYSKSPFFETPRSEVVDLTTPIVLILSVSNLIGIICARSLHYQFWSWYAWWIPAIISSYVASSHSQNQNLARIKSLALSVLGMVLLDRCWCTFPATAQSSMWLLVMNLTLLVLAIATLARMV